MISNKKVKPFNAFTVTNESSCFVKDGAFNGTNTKRHTATSTNNAGKLIGLSDKQLTLTKTHFDSKRRTYS